MTNFPLKGIALASSFCAMLGASSFALADGGQHKDIQRDEQRVQRMELRLQRLEAREQRDVRLGHSAAAVKVQAKIDRTRAALARQRKDIRKDVRKAS